MDKSSLPSGAQLLHLHQQRQQAQKTVAQLSKLLHVDGKCLNEQLDQARREQICQQIDHQIEPLKFVAVHKLKDLGIVRWSPIQQMAIFERLKGKPNFMGRTEDGKTYLNFEETLFLMESGAILMYHMNDDQQNRVPVSIQEAYEILIGDDGRKLNRYLVYSHLVRMGFRVKEHEHKYVKKEETMEEEEMQISRLEESKCCMEEEIMVGGKRKKLQHGGKDSEKREVQQETDETSCHIQQLKENHISSSLKADAGAEDLMSLYRFIRRCKHFYDSNDPMSSMIDKCWMDTQNNWIQHQFDQQQRPDAGIISFDNHLNLNQSFNRPSSLIKMFGNQQDCVRTIDSMHLSQDQLFERMQNVAPVCDVDDRDQTIISQVKCLPDYDLFKPETDRSLKREPDLYLKLFDNQDQEFPVDEILALNASLPNSDQKLVFVLVDRGEITFHRFTLLQF